MNNNTAKYSKYKEILLPNGEDSYQFTFKCSCGNLLSIYRTKENILNLLDMCDNFNKGVIQFTFCVVCRENIECRLATSLLEALMI